jgi:tRNA dimethylallyltransferase
VLIAVVGATGTGKSGLSLSLAEALIGRGQPVEIVNADAMQLYRGMDIGTAKLAPGERRGIRHHLFDVLDVRDEASVADYQTHARAAIADIESRGAWPMLVGGSGLYVSSVIYDFNFPGTDPEIRQRLEAELVAQGPGMMHRRLLEVDRAAATAIGPSNGRRLVRALEVVEMTGEPFGAGLPSADAMWRPTTILGMRAPREKLVPLLDARVDDMWRAGIVDEVAGLLPLGLENGVTASRAIGYAQAIAQIRGNLSEQEAIEETAALTRKYARRQVSWFRRYEAIRWLDYDDRRRLESALVSLDE